MNVSVPAWLYQDQYFSKQFCDDLVNYCDNQLELKSASVGHDPNVEVDTTGVRSSITGWLQDRNDYEKSVKQEIYNLFHNWNQSFNFELTNIYDMQYTVYPAEDNGYYNWHVDSWYGINGSNEDRKLSLSIQLSESDEYEGGEFETESSFIPIPSHEIKNRGTAIMFPSYIRHRVLPVTKGVRKSLVVWIEGPNWK